MTERVLETRTNASTGFIRRRYETPLGHRYSTLEVPYDLWLRITNGANARARVESYLRVQARGTTRRQALALLAAGRTTRFVADHLGLPIRTVQYWRKKQT